MRRLLVTSVVAFAAFLNLPAPALAASTLDQQQTSYDGFSGNSTQCIAQTFTAGLSGHLDRVSIYVRKLTDHPIMRIEVHNIGLAGEPGSTILATQDVAGTSIASTFGWINFDFASAPLVAAGTRYAIVAPPLGPMGPDPVPWGFEWGGAQETVSVDPYPGGRFVSGSSCAGPFGTQGDDLAFQTFVDTEGAFQPDGRIRKNAGLPIGNDIYNDSGDGQKLVANSRPGSRPLFRISIQNDGLVADRFHVGANQGNSPGYRIRYYRGTTEITDAVVAGTYETSKLQPGAALTIEAWVRVKPGAAAGSTVKRLVTITSAGDPSQVDAVKFVVNRL